MNHFRKSLFTVNMHTFNHGTRVIISAHARYVFIVNISLSQSLYFLKEICVDEMHQVNGFQS